MISKFLRLSVFAALTVSASAAAITDGIGSGSATTAATLSQFAATTSAELAGVISNETGTGLLPLATDPVFTTSISIGSAGVKLSDDGDGALTFLSLGNGSGGIEDLTLNFDDTANTVAFSSSTGVTALNFGTIGLTTSGTVNTTGELQSSGSRVGYNLSVYAAGTAYSLTNSAAVLDFGTTDPTLVIDKAGTYIIFGRAYLKYNAATYAGTQTVTVKLRRTNNTAADLTGATTTATMRIITTITDSVGIMEIPPVIYTTSATTDSISVFGAVSAVPAAGSVDATEASIIAVRLY